MTNNDPADNLPSGYIMPRVWTPENGNGGQFTNLNRPVSGATFERELPVGKHPLQLYSQGTPNGMAVTIMLEELLALGYPDAEYDAWLIKTFDGDQFGSGFVAVNPNSKVPALVDHSTPQPTRIFESGSILLYLARKFDAFLPDDDRSRTEAMNWLFWQAGSAPCVGDGFGHFYAYAPSRIKYAIDRFAMETKRQLDVLDRHLACNRYLAGKAYSIADMAAWPWYGGLVGNAIYGDGGIFLEAGTYGHVRRWTDEIAARPAVKRGRIVNRTTGERAEQLLERHDALDFDARAVL
ncbi:glutathione-dependent disulfide-bond oxidoreductase [Rhizobium sp.]